MLFCANVELATETFWASLHGLAELERSGRIRRSARAERVALVVHGLLETEGVRRWQSTLCRHSQGPRLWEALAACTWLPPPAPSGCFEKVWLVLALGDRLGPPGVVGLKDDDMTEFDLEKTYLFIDGSGGLVSQVVGPNLSGLRSPPTQKRRLHHGQRHRGARRGGSAGRCTQTERRCWSYWVGAPRAGRASRRPPGSGRRAGRIHGDCAKGAA